MDIILEFINRLYTIFFDPQKRVFFGYLITAICISFFWLMIIKNKNIYVSMKMIFDKKVFLSKSSFSDYSMLMINTLLLIFLSPILISQLAIANLIYELLHLQTIINPLRIEINYMWLLPFIFTFCYFVFDDFTKFITHAIMHKIPILWAIHKTHHSARTLTPITVFRTHPLEGIIFILRSAITQGIVIALFYYVYGNNISLVTILGANVFSFWFHLAGSNLRHSHIRIGYWPWLEKIIISPAQHQVHHSTKKRHFNKNFGVTFAIWDWAFGSLKISNQHEEIKFGICEKEEIYENNIIYLYISPFIEIYKIIINFLQQNILKLR